MEVQVLSTAFFLCVLNQYTAVLGKEQSYIVEAITTYRQAGEYINSFINLERGQNPFTKRTYRLDRMEFLLSLFDNPEKSFQSIHIAGSKGKGSTAVLFASVLEAAGHIIGLFTSPHISDIRERIRINRKPISIAFYLSLLNAIKNTIDPIPAAEFPGGIRPTFFEIMTLTGFMAFREKRCGLCVIETGLGGRLDATNILSPLATVLTPIEREHEDILGDTLEKIAREKCGIIKPGVPVFSSAQEDCVRTIIRQTAGEKKCELAFIDEKIRKLESRISAKGTRARLWMDSSAPFHFSLSMIGDFQAENASLVIYVIRRLFAAIGLEKIKKGLRHAALPGRMEILKTDPLIIIDGAHTPGSIRRISSTIINLLPTPRILLFAAVSGKKFKEMAEILLPLFEWIIISTPGSFKKSNPQEVYAAFQGLHKNVFLKESIEEAVNQVLNLTQGRYPVLVTGSFYFIAEVKKLFRRTSL